MPHLLAPYRLEILSFLHAGQIDFLEVFGCFFFTFSSAFILRHPKNKTSAPEITINNAHCNSVAKPMKAIKPANAALMARPVRKDFLESILPMAIIAVRINHISQSSTPIMPPPLQLLVQLDI